MRRKCFACTKRSKYYYYLLYGYHQLLKMRYIVDNSNCVQKKIILYQVINENSHSLCWYYWINLVLLKACIYFFVGGLFVVIVVWKKMYCSCRKKSLPSFTCIKSVSSFLGFASLLLTAVWFISYGYLLALICETDLEKIGISLNVKCVWCCLINMDHCSGDFFQEQITLNQTFMIGRPIKPYKAERFFKCRIIFALCLSDFMVFENFIFIF